MKLKNDISQNNPTYFTKSFGELKNGEVIDIRTLTNTSGMELTVLDYGATIQSLKIPVGNQKIDVVLGFDSLTDYEKSFELNGTPFHGAVVGLHAGRIKNGEAEIENTLIQLQKNSGENHIHGGKVNFSNLKWKLIKIEGNNNPSFTYSLETPENFNGYPGKIKATVQYFLLNNNSLKVVFSAETTKTTLINLTQHSYFNLDGQKGSVLNQELKINSKQYLETDKDLIPTGTIHSIEKSVYDCFKDFSNCPEEIDTTFPLKDFHAASLLSHSSNLKMNVYTNQPSVHIYIGGTCQESTIGKENTNYHKHSGICFEAQNFPDSPNHLNFPSSILKKGDTYFSETIFEFVKIN